MRKARGCGRGCCQWFDLFFSRCAFVFVVVVVGGGVEEALAPFLSLGGHGVVVSRTPTCSGSERLRIKVFHSFLYIP